MQIIVTKEFLYTEYVDKQKSAGQIAAEIGTSRQNISRWLKGFSIARRSLAEAQTLALASGRTKHPTQGRHRTKEEKIAIANAVFEKWKEATPEQRRYHSEKCKENWNKLTEQEKQDFQTKSHKAVRKTATDGSKLEIFLRDNLTKVGFAVEYHREKLIFNDKLQLDLFLPEYLLAIEVDGPSHFQPIWGTEALVKTQRADQEKNGLLLRNNFIVLRLQQTCKTVSDKRMRNALEIVMATIEQIKQGKITSSLVLEKI